MACLLKDSTIKEILQKDSGEEIVTETVEHEEHINHNSDTKQEAKPDDVFNIPLECTGRRSTITCSIGRSLFR